MLKTIRTVGSYFELIASGVFFQTSLKRPRNPGQGAVGHGWPCMERLDGKALRMADPVIPLTSR